MPRHGQRHSHLHRQWRDRNAATPSMQVDESGIPLVSTPPRSQTSSPAPGGQMTRSFTTPTNTGTAYYTPAYSNLPSAPPTAQYDNGGYAFAVATTATVVTGGAMALARSQRRVENFEYARRGRNMERGYYDEERGEPSSTFGMRASSSSASSSPERSHQVRSSDNSWALHDQETRQLRAIERARREAQFAELQQRRRASEQRNRLLRPQRGGRNSRGGRDDGSGGWNAAPAA